MTGALWVALVASAAAAIGAVASPLSTWLVARSQRKSDEESRIYKEKVSAYHAVAVDAYVGRELVAECAEQLAKPGVDDARAKALIDKLDTDINDLNKAEPKLLARLAIIAPETVMEARRGVAEAWNQATTELLYDVDRTAPGFAKKARELSEAAEGIVVPAIQKLRVAMRNDLCP
jgi:hypothetical protein